MDSITFSEPQFTYKMSVIEIPTSKSMSEKLNGVMYRMHIAHDEFNKHYNVLIYSLKEIS